MCPELVSHRCYLGSRHGTCRSAASFLGQTYTSELSNTQKSARPCITYSRTTPCLKAHCRALVSCPLSTRAASGGKAPWRWRRWSTGLRPQFALASCCKPFPLSSLPVSPCWTPSTAADRWGLGCLWRLDRSFSMLFIRILRRSSEQLQFNTEFVSLICQLSGCLVFFLFFIF